jgi:predicted acetyltransferase
MESVATLEEYRGKGLIGYIIQHIQQQVYKQGFENLWVFPINERVEKVYIRYGFETFMTVTTGHAFLGGKSITEIQKS